VEGISLLDPFLSFDFPFARANYYQVIGSGGCIALYDNDYLDENPEEILKLIQEFSSFLDIRVLIMPSFRNFLLRSFMKRQRELMKEGKGELESESTTIREFREKYGEFLLTYGGSVDSSFVMSIFFKIFPYLESWGATECGGIAGNGLLDTTVKMILEPFHDVPVYGFPFPIGN